MIPRASHMQKPAGDAQETNTEWRSRVPISMSCAKIKRSFRWWTSSAHFTIGCKEAQKKKKKKKHFSNLVFLASEWRERKKERRKKCRWWRVQVQIGSRMSLRAKRKKKWDLKKGKTTTTKNLNRKIWLVFTLPVMKTSSLEEGLFLFEFSFSFSFRFFFFFFSSIFLVFFFTPIFYRLYNLGLLTEYCYSYLNIHLIFLYFFCPLSCFSCSFLINHSYFFPIF